MDSANHNSYRQIFKSSTLIGGTQVIRLVFQTLQVKALALMLGPAGVGLAGMYTSAIALIGTISGLGIGSAGVRQIAAAAGTGDADTIARTIKTLRRASLLSGLAGMVASLALCAPLSRATFGHSDHAWGIALVSLTLLFGGVSAGQTALLQGLRRLRDLAKCNVLGALFGMIASIVLVYFFHEKGIVWYIVAGSAFAIFSSWWFARKVAVKALVLSWREMAGEARALVGLGLAFMTSGLLGAGSAYLLRVLILHTLGMEAVGLYTATVTLSSLYVGVVLGAMGADFYPRLTGVADDHTAMNRLMNEQTEMGLLLALPGLLATLVLAPWVLRLFYSPEFVGATAIIRWQTLGVALRVVSWPMAFAQLAKGMPRLYALTEFLFNALQVGLIFPCMRSWGLEGLGIAFFLMYVGYVLGMLVVCRYLTGFAWSRKTWLLMGPSISAVVITLLSVRLLPQWQGLLVGLALSLAATAASFYLLQMFLRIDLWRYVRTKFKAKAITI